jgi:hypothetical protein
MLVRIQKGLAWATAFATVFAFYAHSVFQVPSYRVTPLSASAIAGGLVGMAYFGLLQARYFPTESAARQVSSLMLSVALLLAVASTVTHAFADQVLIPEWGVAGVTFGVPVLIILCNVRGELLRAIGVVSLIFAGVDFFADFLEYIGLAHLASHVGKEGSSYGLHYLGLSNSSYATGLVGFIAICFVNAGFSSGTLLGNLMRMVITAGLVASVYLTGTRTYLAAALAATALLVVPSNGRAPLAICSLAIAGLFLYITFNHPAGDQDDALRSMLILDGAQSAVLHPILGAGPSYVDTSSLVATYQQLNGAGIVESGIAQFAIFYGMPAAIALVGASLTAQGAWRPKQSFASVVLCLITAVFAFSSPIGSFLGSITFYTALIYCQRDELRGAQSS